MVEVELGTFPQRAYRGVHSTNALDQAIEVVVEVRSPEQSWRLSDGD